MTDIEIARQVKTLPIHDVGAKLGIPSEHVLPFGHDKGKVSGAVHRFAPGEAGREADPDNGDQPHAGR